MTPPAMAAMDVWLDDRSDAACADAVGARVPVLDVNAPVPVPVLVACALPLDVVVGTSSNLVHQVVRTEHEP